MAWDRWPRNFRKLWVQPKKKKTVHLRVFPRKEGSWEIDRPVTICLQWRAACGTLSHWPFWPVLHAG